MHMAICLQIVFEAPDSRYGFVGLDAIQLCICKNVYEYIIIACITIHVLLVFNGNK